MGRKWHPEDIKAAIRKRGSTMTALALRHGLGDSTVRAAMIRPCYRAEQVVAAFLGVPAQELWPERYDPDGTPRHPRIRRQSSRRTQTSQRQNGGQP